jgi:hypothetical protein
MPEATEEILLHLDVCEACERRLEELEPLLRRYCELRTESLPASPAWRDIGPALDSADALKTKSRTSRSAWAGALAAAATICVFLVWPTGRQSELRAETLLREAERSVPMVGSKRRLEVRTAAGSFIRAAVISGKTETDAVGVRFTAAHYDWNDPLSPASYGKWRDGLKKKKVSVIEDKEQGRIETDTSEGELLKASLTITENNMRVVAGRFEFADRQWVEIAALPDAEEAPAAALPPNSAPARPTEPELPPRFAQPVAERELRVWAAIDGLNLGAGTPVNVEVVNQEQLLVTADHLDPSQEQLLRARIAGIQGAAVEIASGDAGVAARAVDPAINASEGIVARAHFLARLQTRFPISTEAALDLPDRRMLWEMRRRCVSLLNQDIELLGGKIGKVAPSGAMPASSTVAELVESATIVDRLVTSLFANANADPDRERLSEEFNKLRQIASEYARSLGEEPSR